MSTAWWWVHLHQRLTNTENPLSASLSVGLEMDAESIANERLSTMSSNEDIHKVIDMIGHHRICMMTAVGADNTLQGWPMTVMKVEDDGELWFFSSIGASPVEEVGTESQVNLSFTGKNDWLSVHGFAAIITSEPKAREMWNEAAAAFYPDGPESKDLVLIRVRPEGAQYWESPGGAISTAFQWAKARMTGEEIDVGESRTLNL